MPQERWRPVGDRRARSRALFALVLAPLGCRQPSSADAGGATSAAVRASATASSPTSPRPSTSAAKATEPPKTVERDEGSEAGAAPEALASLIIDAAIPVAPAGPGTASAHGVVLTKRNGEAVVARLAPAQPRGTKAATTAIEPLEMAATELIARSPRPAIAGDAAYFIRGGALRRVALPAGGASTEIANDARDGARVAATLVTDDTKKQRAAVAYLSETPTRLVARLWVEGAPSVLTLTPEGSEASTMALAAVGPELIAVTLEARTGMSTVHARRISVKKAEPELGEDVVVWVGGSAQSVTEISALAGPGDDSWALTAIEHDATHFGLARIRVAQNPSHGAEVFWRDYPNGVDPAPLAVGSVCDQRLVLYARPATPEPRAPQELHAAIMGPDGLGASRILVGAPAFANVSLAALPGGALVGYVAEGRTWAATIRCPKG
ncbi:MAG: hypothetical protein JW751_06190 [Polyangiaceae bacterium]|nr:hypothetical protein [Polyangiaceae bacterium]